MQTPIKAEQFYWHTTKNLIHSNEFKQLWMITHTYQEKVVYEVQETDGESKEFDSFQDAVNDFNG